MVDLEAGPPLAVDARGVVVKHGRTVAVQSADLAIPVGQTVAFVGPNGSGKSSLLRVLAGLARPHGGSVRLGGADVHRLPARERAGLVASVAQDEHTDLPFTARDVLLLGRSAGMPDWRPMRRADHDAVDQLATRWGLTELLDRTLQQMSGGERRRVLLARAFAQGADIVFLDEPTNHLDLRHQHDLLAELADGSGTTVLALHDLDLAAVYCQRVVLLAAGRVVADGSPEEVLTAQRVAEVFQVAARRSGADAHDRLIIGR